MFVVIPSVFLASLVCACESHNSGIPFTVSDSEEQNFDFMLTLFILLELVYLFLFLCMSLSLSKVPKADIYSFSLIGNVSGPGVPYTHKILF
jgi:hypothetical protein